MKLREMFKRTHERETLAEAYEVRGFRDEIEQPVITSIRVPEIAHPEPGALQEAKNRIKGHGEQQVLPDDCQFGDNEMCYPEP